MSKTFRIAVDIDGVICNFTQAFAERINKLYPGAIPEGYEPPNWDWTDVLTKEMSDATWADIDKDPDFWGYLDCYCDNAQAMHTFLREHPEIEVYYVTARQETTGKTLLAQTIEWLDGRGLMTSNTSVITVKNGKFKGHVFGAIGADLSIDDSWENVAASLSLSINEGANFLLDRSWNRGISYGLRIGSLREFLDYAAFLAGAVPAVAAPDVLRVKKLVASK